MRNRTDKVGFVTPEAHWIEKSLGTLAADVLGSRAFRERGLVDPQAAASLLARRRAGEIGPSYDLWRVLNLELWARAFLDRGRS